MNFLVVGYGKIGEAIAKYLTEYDVGVVDSDKKALKDAEKHGYEVYHENIAKGSLAGTMRRYDCVISAVPYRFNYELAREAVEAGTHFCDLGGNDTIVDKELSLHEEAKGAGITILPDCGLAPGLADILAAFAYSKECREIHMRVGGLPQQPRGPLRYKTVFSLEGLLNEYVERVRILKNGKVTHVKPLTGLEEITFGKNIYEAFYTSGGTSTLPRTFEGKLERLDYKTIRYPGHCHLIRAFTEMGLTATDPMELEGQSIIPREVLMRLLSRTLSYESEDIVLLRVTAEGERHVQYNLVDYQKEFTAMARTTAYPAVISAILITESDLTGALPQEIVIPRLIRERQYLKELEKNDIIVEKQTGKV